MIIIVCLLKPHRLIFLKLILNLITNEMVINYSDLKK